MRRCLLMLLAVAFVACGPRSTRQATEQTSPTNGVEVLSFHTKQRCPTCLTIEQLAREVVEGNFAAQLADGSLAFRVVDISEQEALSDKYEVAWSSLLIVRHKDQVARVNDLTKFAFANARTNPEKVRAELKIRIEKLLDQ